MKFNKRIKALTLAAGLILTAILTGCTGIMGVSPESLDLNRAYSFTAQIDYEGFSATAEIQRVGERSWTAMLTEPAALQGLSVVYEGGGATMSYAGFTIEPDKSVTNMVTAITDVLENAIAKENLEVISAKEHIQLSGTSTLGAYVLKLDKATGLPLTLSVSELRLEVVFSNVVVAEFAEEEAAFEETEPLETEAESYFEERG